MSGYELMVILRSELKEAEVKGIVTAIKNKVKEFGGKVEKEDYWGIRKFAYELKKQTQGYYNVFILKLDPTKISEFRVWLKHQEKEVLRYMMTKINE